MGDTRLKVVTIMNYAPDPRYRRMCYAFLDSVISHGAASVTILYEDQPPTVAPEHRRTVDIEVVRCQSHDIGHPHFNLRFKLANLAALDFPFLYLDADTVVLGDLNYLWSRRHAKPWVGIDHQMIPADPRTHRSPFLNSGVQLVSDPAFYDLRAILAVQNAAAPLEPRGGVRERGNVCLPRDGSGDSVPILPRDWVRLHTPGDRAGMEQLRRGHGGNAAGDRWKAHTRGLPADHDVYLMHYWSQFKPWMIDCPIYASYANRDEELEKLTTG